MHAVPLPVQSRSQGGGDTGNSSAFILSGPEKMQDFYWH
jgi:hypothetical protein